MSKPNLAELPHELWDQIMSHITTAKDVSHLGRSSKALHHYVEEEGWGIFARSKFSGSALPEALSWPSFARSLTTVSRAWDRRAYVVRDFEPSGSIITYPGRVKIERWKKPSGQTMGFTPQLDAFEPDHADSRFTDVLAMGAGAQVCLRRQIRKISHGKQSKKDVAWSIYRPHGAREGRDDVTSLHLIHSSKKDVQEVITGTANGDLQHISIPFNDGDSHTETYFTTQGLPIQSTSLRQHPGDSPLLAAALGHARVALYPVDPGKPKIAPGSSVDFRGQDNDHPSFAARACRIWTTNILSQDHLALGIGQSKTPLQICPITPSGLDRSLIRSFALATQDGGTLEAGCVSAISPLLKERELFFSGAYDGVVRLHDLRTPHNTEAFFTSPNSDNSIYCLLSRGQQTLLAGTSRHDVVHVFDIRMSSRQYRNLNITNQQSTTPIEPGYSLFVNPKSGVGRHQSGSVYSLASSSPESPFVYLGRHNTFTELAAAEISHPHPDPLHFKPWTHPKRRGSRLDWSGWQEHTIKNVARYENNVLSTQADLQSTWQKVQAGAFDQGSAHDMRWQHH